MSVSLFKHAFEVSGIGQAMFAFDGEIIDYNQSFCDLFGRSKNDTANLNINDLFFGEPFILKDIEEQLMNESTARHFQIKKPYVHENGNIFWGLVSISLFQSHDRERSYYLVQIQNITNFVTEMNDIIIDLSNSEERYRYLVDHSPDAIYIHNQEQIFFVNKRAKELFDISKKGLSFFSDKGHPQEALRYIEELLNDEKQVRALRTKTFTKDNREVEVEITSMQTKYDGQKAIHSIVRDVTVKNQEEQLIQKSEKLAVVGEIAAAFAHEVRNPITTVKGFMQLLQLDKTYNEQYSNVIFKEILNIERIVYDFLSLAKPHEETKFVYCDICEIMKQVVSYFDNKASSKNYTIQFNNSDESHHMECEPDFLKKVFKNIIQNAIEALNKNGTVLISIEHFEGKYVIIEIKDNGCGIPDNKISRLGEPFYSTKEKGTGLGLMTSMKIIENHQGMIKISSQEGEGTSVRIILPVSQENGKIKMYEMIQIK